MTSDENDAVDDRSESIEEQIRTKFISLMSDVDDIDESVAGKFKTLFAAEVPTSPSQIIDAVKLAKIPDKEGDADEAD